MRTRRTTGHVLGLALGLALAAASAPGSALAEGVIATRNLRPGTIIAAADLSAPDAAEAAALVGLEVRRTVYAGREVTPDALGAPRVVMRNDLVSLVFLSGGLGLRTEGRALDEGAVGERIRVMNLSSRLVITAVVREAGLVEAVR